MTLQIKTNHQPRPVMYWDELPTDIQTKEFDWVDDSISSDLKFTSYKGNIICLDDYMLISNDAPAQVKEGGWQGYTNDSAFSGTFIKFTEDLEKVIIATFKEMSSHAN